MPIYLCIKTIVENNSKPPHKAIQNSITRKGIRETSEKFNNCSKNKGSITIEQNYCSRLRSREVIVSNSLTFSGVAVPDRNRNGDGEKIEDKCGGKKEKKRTSGRI